MYSTNHMSNVQWVAILFIKHALLSRCQSQTNQWRKDIGPTGEDIWRSTSDFIPVQSQSFGTIQLGQIMSVEFDFVWHGRSNDPRPSYYENFFRVGYDANVAEDCYGQGARYPSFWLTNDMDTMHVSVSSGGSCQPSHSLNTYGIISVNVSYHLKIAFNSTQLRIDVSGGGKANWTKKWPRTGTLQVFLGDQVPVWWMSNKLKGTNYNRGNATFSNIVMISKLFTQDPTPIPTVSPTTASPTLFTLHPTSTPTANPTNTPSVQPTLIPTNTPTFVPTNAPSLVPTNGPTVVPTNTPSMAPTTTAPTHTPSLLPTNEPTSLPSDHPSHTPTIQPSASPMYTTTTALPSDHPSYAPTTQPISTREPTPTPVYGPLIECKHNEDCTIVCEHPYDCHSSTVLCPKTSNKCNVHCTEYACQHITINAHFNDGGSIHVQCNGVNSCLGAIIDAHHSINTTLSVQISDTRALSGSHIYCADLECNITTMGGKTSSEGLLNANIIAQDHTQRLSLILHGDRVLQNSTIQCPQKQSETDKVCQIIMGNHNQTYRNMLNNAIIQSQGGLNDIDLMYDYSNSHQTPQIQCGAHYEYACEAERVSIMTNNDSQTYWRCRDDIHSDFECDNADYIDLICVINGGNIALINKQVDTIEALVVLLDGDTFTYDPWIDIRGRNALNKTHLSFEWECTYQIGTSVSSQWMDCNEMLNGLDHDSVAYAYFNTQTITENEYYVYRYTLHAADTTNSKRSCASTPSITVSISTISKEEDIIDIPLLVASIQVLDHDDIYQDTPIRLMGKLSTLDETDVNLYFYKYFWNEISGRLSANELLSISNSLNQKNLIIDSHSLVEGNEYAFQLTVEQYTDGVYETHIQTIESQSITIMVHTPDVSLINSTVIIEDDCILNPIQYDTLKDLFHGFFNITFNGQNALQNRYQFGYSIENYMDNEKILLHSSLITSQTYFNHFVLPLSSSIIFHVEILDEDHKSVEINTTAFCMIEIETPYACVSYTNDVYRTFKPSDTSALSELEQKQLFVVQTAHSVLHLLQTQTMDMIDRECTQQYMDDILHLMTADFADLCESDFILQLAQVLTNWIRIAVSDPYLSDKFMNDSAYLEHIYDLSVQVLDPCLSFIYSDANSLRACSDSVITSQSAVCYNDDHNPLFVSKLFITNRYSYIFLSFIESLITVLDRTLQMDQIEISTDLFALIRKSLHVYQLLGLSVSIPYEWSVYDSNTFQLCSYRTLNENVECNGSDIAVFLTANDTKHGKKDLDDIDSDLNGVDISVIFLQTNKSKAFVVDPCSHQKRQNELQGGSATILLSSDANTSNLTSNVSITFEHLDDEQVLCVWYNEESGVWDTSGCTTSVDKDNGRVRCSCSHLTTFSTIKYLYNDCLDTDVPAAIKHYPYGSNLIFLILFLALFTKITSDFVLIFDGACVKRCIKHRKDGALSGPGSVYICTVFELLVCVEFHIAFTLEWEWHKPILIFTLLLPLLSFCWMFFCLLRTWIRITHSFGAETIIVQRIEKGMVVFMVLLVLFVGVEGVLIYTRHDYYIYGEIIWCFIMSVFTVTYVIYATSAIKTIWISVMAVKNDIINQNDDEDTKLLRKLLIVSILLAIYFLIKTFLSIYLAVNHDHSFVWRIIDMFMQLVSLCIIYCLYGGGIKRLVNKYNNTPMWIKCYRQYKSIKPKRSTQVMKVHDQTATALEMGQKNDDTNSNPYRKTSHALVVSHSRQSIDDVRPKVTQSRRKRKNIYFRNATRKRVFEQRPHMINCPSDTVTTTNSMDLNSSTVQTRTGRHKSTTDSFTPSLSALPTLSQLESAFDQNHPHHHLAHSSSSYEGSLFSQFSNIARTRFPSTNMDFDAPLPEQPDHFEESSVNPMSSAPEPGQISDDSQQYHE